MNLPDPDIPLGKPTHTAAEVQRLLDEEQQRQQWEADRRYLATHARPGGAPDWDFKPSLPEPYRTELNNLRNESRAWKALWYAVARAALPNEAAVGGPNKWPVYFSRPLPPRTERMEDHPAVRTIAGLRNRVEERDRPRYSPPPKPAPPEPLPWSERESLYDSTTYTPVKKPLWAYLVPAPVWYIYRAQQLADFAYRAQLFMRIFLRHEPRTGRWMWLATQVEAAQAELKFIRSSAAYRAFPGHAIRLQTKLEALHRRAVDYAHRLPFS